MSETGKSIVERGSELEGEKGDRRILEKAPVPFLPFLMSGLASAIILPEVWSSLDTMDESTGKYRRGKRCQERMALPCVPGGFVREPTAKRGRAERFSTWDSCGRGSVGLRKGRDKGDRRLFRKGACPLSVFAREEI
jgi:hypothetical protein